MKQELRRRMRAMAKESPRDSAAVCANLDRWLAKHPALRTIAVFAALPGEVDLTDWIRFHPGIRWVFPRVTGNHLTFHQILNPMEHLVNGAFGIREPHPDLTEAPVETIDAFFCPGLAFDKRGGRLGRGRGFYDRLLANARPDAIKVGVGFPWQIVDDTFAEPHDIAMDAVVF